MEITKEVVNYVEETYPEELREIMGICIDEFDENLTCYDNFRDLIPFIFAVGYRVGVRETKVK